jgi:fucose 4-O-acetylase-like acetyltransferase
MTYSTTSARGGAASPLLREIPYDKPQARLLDIDAARGLAIFLVVLGHVVARDFPAGNEWFVHVKAAVYSFHMPLFMVLTGITFALSLPRFADWGEVARHSGRRVERLFLPYIAFGLLIVAGKALASRYIHVDRPPEGLLEEIVRLVALPNMSAAGFLWFVYVLSVYLLAIPALFQLAGRRPQLLLAAGVALALVDWPAWFMLNRVFEYLPFFALGMLLWMHRAAWQRITPAALWASTAVFALLLWYEAPKWAAGAASVLPVLGWMQRLPAAPQRWLAALGLASLAIYLMNTIAIGVTKGLMLKLFSWDGANFLVYLPVLTAAGIAAPMLVRRLALRHAPRAARYLT